MGGFQTNVSSPWTLTATPVSPIRTRSPPSCSEAWSDGTRFPTIHFLQQVAIMGRMKPTMCTTCTTQYIAVQQPCGWSTPESLTIWEVWVSTSHAKTTKSAGPQRSPHLSRHPPCDVDSRRANFGSLNINVSRAPLGRCSSERARIARLPKLPSTGVAAWPSQSGAPNDRSWTGWLSLDPWLLWTVELSL